eukprot:TRINITY_DN35877_c0_g1_i1.p1 TRINITY_DN35877_c0_g1~~TRINITY_DN35877_c0_g1_i1.p1  ORF type:complete len:182 (+),score=33.02 TRINITY_DN35877_c0_g1_i1:94-639(+)
MPHVYSYVGGLAEPLPCSGHGRQLRTSFQVLPGASSYGGLMSQGYVPPGQFEDLLNLIRQSSAAAERAMNAAKYAEMASSAAGVAGQQAVVRAMHMANAPGAPSAAPFGPGTPEMGSVGMGLAAAPIDPRILALAPTLVSTQAENDLPQQRRELSPGCSEFSGRSRLQRRGGAQDFLAACS